MAKWCWFDDKDARFLPAAEWEAVFQGEPGEYLVPLVCWVLTWNPDATDDESGWTVLPLTVEESGFWVVANECSNFVRLQRRRPGG
jgi:hypothetical protein